MLEQRIIKVKQQSWRKFNSRHFKDVIKQLLKVQKYIADDAESMYLLGCSYANLQQWDDAIKAFEKSIRIQPDVSQSHFAYAGALISIGETGKAKTSLDLTLKFNESMVEAHITLANLLITDGEIDEAKERINEALKIKPDLSEAYAALGRIEQESGNYIAAYPFLEKAVLKDSKNTYALCALAAVLTNLTRKKEAIDCYKKVLRIDNNNIEAIASLSQLYAFYGDYKKAEALIQPLLKKKIYHPTVAIAFSQICHRTDSCLVAVEYIDKILRLNESPKPVVKSLNFAAGRLLDKIGDYAEAFSHYKTGNDVMKKMYDGVSHKKYINNLINLFTPAFYMEHAGHYATDERPIFIIGMPRSGTSLTEQILSAHTDVYAAGELIFLDSAIKHCRSKINSAKHFPLFLNKVKNEYLMQIASEYINKIKGLSKTAIRVTDKMPHNFYYLGLIQLILPNARIIHCTRNPMDTCLSIYFQDFFEHHTFAKDLFDIGTHYNQYQHLMGYWKRTLSIPILDISYEDLVNNQVATTKQLLEFCGLDWQEECLDFHHVSRVVDTASVHQVRQPLYKKSIGRWHHYEEYLGDLKRGLAREF